MARILNALNSHRHFHIAVQVRAVTHTATLYQHSHDLASFFSWGGGGGRRGADGAYCHSANSLQFATSFKGGA